MEGDAPARAHPGREVSEIRCDVRVVVQPVNEEKVYRLVPLHLARARPDRLDEIGHAGLAHVKAEPVESGRQPHHPLIEAGDFALVRVNSVDARGVRTQVLEGEAQRDS